MQINNTFVCTKYTLQEHLHALQKPTNASHACLYTA